jgi:hypothetical protein
MKSPSNFIEFSKVAQELSDKALNQLRKLILDLPNNLELFSYSAHYAGVDKLVLWNSDDKTMQIRLHVYSGHCCNKNIHNQIDTAEAHNHRWNFLARILAGGYHHTIYRMELLDIGKYHVSPSMIRYEGIGSSYALHHSQYHSIIEETGTVSLIVRGPIEKEHFQVITQEGGEVQPKDASNLQTPEEKKQKVMTLVDYEKILNQLLYLKII